MSKHARPRRLTGRPLATACLLAAAALCVLAALSALPASAGQVQAVNKPWTELKAGAPSFVLGNLPAHSLVYVYGPQNHGYRWARSPQLGFCVWVFDRDVDPAGGAAPNQCGTPRKYPISMFTNGQIGKSGPGQFGNDGAPARLAPARCGGKVGLYANVAPWRAHTLSGAALQRWHFQTLTTRHAVRWRYVTKDGRFVLVRDPAKPSNGSTPHWYFVRRACIDLNT